MAKSAAWLLLAAAVASGQDWPGCQERHSVLRHAGRHGVFLDLVPLGAKEGCWQGDCTRSDKYLCPSAEECAAGCGALEACHFWTYELEKKRCYFRGSDGGREEHPDFVSGSRSCLPARPARTAALDAPFARAALWAAQLPALRPCDAGVGSPGCENPYAAMGVWRYAANNLRLAVAGLPESERRQHGSTLAYVSRVAEDVATFYRQPTGETFQVAVSNARQVFGALAPWLQGSPPVQLQVPTAPLVPTVELEGRNAATARVKLADGREMPLLGFGTWQLLGQQAYEATLAALRSGYRHIDTAQAYMNEEAVGAAIRDSGVPREELFIATKISDPGDFPALEQRLAAQLAALGTDYLDLYMLHTPEEKGLRELAWRSMERMHALGRVRSLGVSNFGPAELRELVAFAEVKPVYLQNKFSVYNPGEQMLSGVPLLSFARELGLQVVGYSVLNAWPLLLPPLEDPHVLAAARRSGRSAAQVLHRWALQKGVAVIPRSGTEQRIRENAELFDFALGPAEVRLLDGLVTLSESTAGSVLPGWAEDVYGLGASVL